jgi:protein-disulfide isomerase
VTRLILLAAAAALAAPAAAAPVRHAAAPVHHAAAARDWSRVVAATPQGGFRMGNPDAPVKLVEYASLSCPYCAKFDREGVPTLREKYVKSGRVSWEYRTYLNHPTDPAVAALVHCQGAQAFFATADQLYASQQQWYGKLVAYPPQQYRRLADLSPLQRDAAIARITGLDDFFRRRGMASARIQACLADRAMLDRLAAIVELGNNDGVNGTPNFMINGRLLPDVAEWKTLEPQLMAAIR